VLTSTVAHQGGPILPGTPRESATARNGEVDLTRSTVASAPLPAFPVEPQLSTPLAQQVDALLRHLAVQLHYSVLDPADLLTALAYDTAVAVEPHARNRALHCLAAAARAHAEQNDPATCWPASPEALVRHLATTLTPHRLALVVESAAQVTP
jgi:hypothetical protein